MSALGQKQTSENFIASTKSVSPVPHLDCLRGRPDNKFELGLKAIDTFKLLKTFVDFAPCLGLVGLTEIGDHCTVGARRPPASSPRHQMRSAD